MYIVSFLSWLELVLVYGGFRGVKRRVEKGLGILILDILNLRLLVRIFKWRYLINNGNVGL